MLGNRIADILIERAANGVKVRLMYDHVGSFSVRSRFFKRLRDHGIEAYPFFRVTFPQLATRINWRNHRKICIIDQCIGYLGGMNVADRYIDGGKNLKTGATPMSVSQGRRFPLFSIHLPSTGTLCVAL